MSMLVQQSKRRISALVGTQVKVSTTFAPSSSISEIQNNNDNPIFANNSNSNNNNNNVIHKKYSQYNPKPPTPPKPQEEKFSPSTSSSSSSITSSPSPSSSPSLSTSPISSNNENEDHFPSLSPPPATHTYNKNRKMNHEHMPANMKRVSNERIFHGKSFDSRVEALKYLLTSHHFATLFRTPTTTPKQADLLLEHAQTFGIADTLVFHSYLRFYSRRGNITQVLRTIDRMRARGIAYSDRERMQIDRAHRRARVYGGIALRATVARAWAQLGDVEMCVRCYDAMRAAGTHPGLPGYTALLRIFAEKGDTEMSARLLSDMDALGVNAHTKPGVLSSNVVDESLGLDTFKSLLRFHAGLAERDVCERLMEELRNRGLDIDDEVNEIVVSLDQQETEKERDNEEDEPAAIETTERQTTHAKKSRQFSHTPNNTQLQQQQPNPFTQNNATLHNTHQSFEPLQQPTILQQPTKTDLDLAMEDFENAKLHTPEECHSLLKLAANAGDRDACEKVLAAMDAANIARTQETYAYAIDALKGDPVRCIALYAEMRAHAIKPSRTAYNAMLWVYCAARLVSDAFALFDEMKEEGVADTMAYNTFMRVYASDSNLQSIMGLSSDMKRRGISHDISTYNIIVGVLGKFGVKGTVIVDAVVREMEQNNIQPDVVMYDTLMDIYGAAGQWKKCEEIWKEIERKGIILGTGSCARFLEKHCRREPNLYAKWKKEFSSFLPP